MHINNKQNSNANFGIFWFLITGEYRARRNGIPTQEK